MRKLICLLAYEGMELLDFAGPQSAFYEALEGMDDSYELKIVCFDRIIVQCEAGLQFIPSTSVDNVGACHTLIILGGKGAQSPSITSPQLPSDLLATTEKEIKTIALVVGFKTYHGLARAFERCFSVTPTAYRKAFLLKS